MMGLHPFFRDQHLPRTRYVREPARASARAASHAPVHHRTGAPNVDPQPHIEILEERRDAYVIGVTPPASMSLSDTRAVLEPGGAIVLEGEISTPHARLYEYQTRRRAGVFSAPSRSSELIGVVPAGHNVRGTAPSSSGWIALDDDDSYILDDGSLALVGRPHRPVPFAKRLALPADADVRRATSEPLRRGGGGLLVTVPRVARGVAASKIKTQPAPEQLHAAQKRAPTAHKPPAAPPAARSVPVNVHKRPPPTPPAAKPAAPGAAAAGKASTTTKDADEFKQEHKRRAAERRGCGSGMSETLRALQGDDYEGPVLSECSAAEVSPRNVQSPIEQVEEWLAIADGGFVRNEADHDWIVVDGVTTEAECAGDAAASSDGQKSDDEELSFWGF